MSDILRDEDKELAQLTFLDIMDYVRAFSYKDISLNASYDGLKSGTAYSISEGFFMFKNRKLQFNLNEKIIYVKRIDEDESVTPIDEIIISNGIVNCKHGPFKVNEIDSYLTECFKDLL